MPARSEAAIVPPIPVEVLAAGEPVPDLEPGRGVLADPADPDYRPWRITGRRAAEWAMGKLLETVQDLEPIRARHAEWRAGLAKLETEETGALVQRGRFFLAHLVDYALGLRAGTGDTDDRLDGARLKLGNGHVQTVEHGPRVAVADDDAAVAWVKAHHPKPETMLRVVETLTHEAADVLAAPYAVPVTVRLTCECPVVDVGNDGLAEAGTGEMLVPVLLEVGRGVICPECSHEALVASWVDVRWAALDADGREVPGLVAHGPTVTATVYPGGQKITEKALK